MKQLFTMNFLAKSWVPFLGAILLSFLLLVSCEGDTESASNKPFGNCRYGAPKAIFKPTFPKVTKHNFQLNKAAAVENIAFENGLTLELVQSGCEKPRQEFQFDLAVDTDGFTDTDWINLGVELFGFMGNLAPELQPFLLWQGALKDKISQLKLGLPHELEQGFMVKIDKVAGGDASLLIMALYQK
ncbi:MAG: hypothetical protein AAGJ18_08180 [Bacteroidota bacterium]